MRLSSALLSSTCVTLVTLGCAHEAAPDAAEAKAARLRQVHVAATASRNVYLNPGLVDDIRLLWEDAEREGTPARVLGGELSYASYLMYQGRIDESIRHFEACAERVAGVDFDDSLRCEVLFRLGLAYFRLAERQNCIEHHNAQSCIFPLSAQAQHVDEEGAAKALATLERLLAIDAEYREAQWLLNIAHMALGSYPDGLPERYLYPPERFRSELEMARFVDVAPELGLNRFGRAGGVVLDDLDGDGRLDVMTSAFDTSQSLRLFRNAGDGSFEDVTERAGLADQLGGLNLVQADVDGDGRLDVLVLRGGELNTDGEMPNSLLRQVEPGVFRDVTEQAGIEVAAPTQTAAFADVDRDGDLDLFVGYESFHIEPDGDPAYPSHLYRNDGAGRFDDITDEAGVRNDRACAGAAFGDLDADGFPELYVSNRRQPNRFYVSAGDGKFVDMAADFGLEGPMQSSVPAFFDYDNDGDLDLFVAFHEHHLAERAVASFYWDGTVTGDTARLYENHGKIFEDVTERRGLRRVDMAVGANLGDVDNDGFLDIYLGTGAGEMSALFPNVLLRNDGGERFQDATEAAGVGHLQKGRGIAFGDVDDDGDQDIFVVVGGFHLDDGFGDVLFENPGNQNRWLTVELEGVETNRFGIGSRIRVRVEGPAGERDVFAFVGARGFGGNSLRQEIGLGDATSIRELEIRWQASDEAQTFTEVPLDRHVRAREGDPELRVLERHALQLGGH